MGIELAGAMSQTTSIMRCAETISRKKNLHEPRIKIDVKTKKVYPEFFESSSRSPQKVP
jgi:hypothetical protein